MNLLYLLKAALTRRVLLRGQPSLPLLLALCLTSGVVIVSASLAVDDYLSHRVGPASGPPEGFAGSGQRLFPPGTRMPDFLLPAATGDREVSLARLRAEGKPIVLVFASFTCTVFHGHLEKVESLFHQYRERAHFLFVNIREAGHTIDGYEYLLSEQPVMGSGTVKRCRDVDRAAKKAGLTLPIVVDAYGQVAETYKAWPLRLMVLDPQGQVAFDLGLGSQGIWDLDGLENWLRGVKEKTG